MPALEELRAKIDSVDAQIIELLAERAGYVHQVAELKNTDEEVVAEERQQEVYRTRRAWARQHELDPDFIENLYRFMIEYFIKQERRVIAARNQKHE
ncbi:MAG TPA: chorismate mutase [Aggregatilineales bacterium]|nr:chorismate mutase [Aggregatilineales bacterium]